jgi:ATP-dependent DNA helicase RecQ
VESAEHEAFEPNAIENVRRVARERFGITRLRREQERAMSSSLAGRDTLLIMPTGGGKSLCYQLPSLLLPNPTIVVSPLLALLQDQFGKLQELGIPSIRLDSTVGAVARREALERLRRGGSLLVLTTPETLAGAELSEILDRIPPSLVAVDEAHCISEWGHDFRPAYLALGQRLQQLKVGNVLGLTATATPQVRADILRYLALRDPEVIVSSVHRQNLVFEVRRLRGDEKLRHLAKLARRLPRPGIIYCATTKAVDDVWLGLRLIKVPCARYHGKMSDKERTQHQARFMEKGKRIIMVATSAFGLGIDKPDIRYIIHYQAPSSLERYVQEAGRAGRDGHIARCFLLFDDTDLEIQEHLLSLSRLSPALLGRFGRALAAWAEEQRDANIEELALSAGISQRAATSLVTVLVEAGLCERADAGRVRALGPIETLVERVEGLRGRFEVLRREDARRLKAMVEYADDRTCRSTALRRYFGEDDPPVCGRCDLCRTLGVAEPQRGRRHRPRSGAAGSPAPRPASIAAAAANGADGAGSSDRRRRRRRRRRGNGQPGDGSRPFDGGARRRAESVSVAPRPLPPPQPVLEPLDPAAVELAAELGAPALPPLARSEAPVPPPSAPGAQERPGGRGRRRRRRRRGGRRGHPEGGAPSPPAE